MKTQCITGTGYNQEDSYFHEKDEALLAKKRAQLDAHRSVDSSLMCPRCEAAMTEVALEHVKLDRCIADDTNAWELREDGSWERRSADPREPRNAQRELMDRHAARAAESQQS